jgi:hypothetical protein
MIQILVQLPLSCRQEEDVLGSARKQSHEMEIPSLAAGRDSVPACLVTPDRRRRARVWHTLDSFLTSQIKWNNSHHISQAKRPLDFQYGTISILHHYTP